MKKLFKFILVIILFYLLFNLLLGKTSDTISYQIRGNETFNIKEIHNSKSYYYEVTTNGIVFNFDVNYKLNRKNIVDVKFYKDNNYICILPIFEKNKTYTDIICKKDDLQYLYNTMNDRTYDLIQFRNSLTSIYEIGLNSSEYKSFDFIKLYVDNLEEDKYIVINNYKGVYLFSKNYNKSITLFNNDIYNQEIKGVIGKYYIVADYNEKHEFSNFNIVDIETGKVNVLKTNYKISIESIFQGIYDNKMYIYDSDNKVQYEINPFKMICQIVGNEKKGIKIFNQEFKTYQISELKDFKFNENRYEDSLIVLEGNKEYYYLKGDNFYKKYYNSEIETILFKNIYGEIRYSNNYICMLKNDDIYCYDGIGEIRKVVNYKEFLFNKNITFYNYIK